MSGSRFALSALILGYLAAVTANAIPVPEGGSEASRPGTATLLQRSVLAAASPIRRLTERYITSIVPQRWNMFSSPRKFDQYVRLTYYVTASGDRNPTTVREFIYPALADNEIRVT